MVSLFGIFWNAGPMELLVLGLIILLLFGNRLPSVMRSLGRGVVEFKKGVSGVEEEVNEAVTSDETPKKEKEKEKQTAEK
jgi:sec-independent protein translocase protein TatA